MRAALCKCDLFGSRFTLEIAILTGFGRYIALSTVIMCLAENLAIILHLTSDIILINSDISSHNMYSSKVYADTGPFSKYL